MKILFYDKQIYWNCPKYSHQLLDYLIERGHDVLVVTGNEASAISSPSRVLEEKIGLTFKELYKNYNHIEINSLFPLKMIIQKYSPSVFLCNFAIIGFGRRAVELAKKMNVNVVEMDTIASEIMLYGSDWYKDWFRFHPRSIIYYLKSRIRDIQILMGFDLKHKTELVNFNLKLIADSLCVKGLFFKKYIDFNKRRGTNSDKIKVTGSLFIDYIQNIIPDKKYLAKKYSIDFSLPIIIIAPNPIKVYLKNRAKSENFLVNVLRKIKTEMEVNIIINLHPSDRLKYPERFDELNIYKSDSKDFYSLLKLSTCVVSSRSTIGLETASASAPILIDESETPQLDFNYYQDNLRVGVPIKLSNVCTIIKSIVNEEEKFNFNEFNNHYTNGNDGLAYHRITEQIETVGNKV